MGHLPRPALVLRYCHFMSPDVVKLCCSPTSMPIDGMLKHAADVQIWLQEPPCP